MLYLALSFIYYYSSFDTTLPYPPLLFSIIRLFIIFIYFIIYLLFLEIITYDDSFFSSCRLSTTCPLYFNSHLNNNLVTIIIIDNKLLLLLFFYFIYIIIIFFTPLFINYIISIIIIGSVFITCNIVSRKTTSMQGRRTANLLESKHTS